MKVFDEWQQTCDSVIRMLMVGGCYLALICMMLVVKDFKDLWLQNMLMRIHGELLLLLLSMQLAQMSKSGSLTHITVICHVNLLEAFKALSYVGHEIVNSMKLCNDVYLICVYLMRRAVYFFHHLSVVIVNNVQAKVSAEMGVG